jgi:hypothetical protein
MATDPLRHCAEYETIRRHIAVPSDSGLSEKMENYVFVKDTNEFHKI